MNIVLNKKDVAQRQLATAIRLFFEKDDSVSIYSLAANAWEIIDVLCNKAGTNSLSNQSRENISKTKDLKRNFINSPYRNFFKHADNDFDAILKDFDASKVDSILILAVEDYLRLYLKGPIEFQVYQLWYLAVYKSKIAAEDLKGILEAIIDIFPDIEKMPRDEQIALGNQILKEYLLDKHLLADPCTELLN
jgi:hypothetical protein